MYMSLKFEHKQSPKITKLSFDDTWIGFGPYLKRTPLNCFLRLTGPTEEEEEEGPSIALELLAILELADLSERPRTIPNSQEDEDWEAGEEDDICMSQGI